MAQTASSGLTRVSLYVSAETRDTGACRITCVAERQTHDYARHGVVSLFAALNVATGKVTDAYYPRHRHQEFLKFLKQVAASIPRHRAARDLRQLRHAQAQGRTRVASQAGEPADHAALHANVSCSWLNLVECFFSIITRQAIRRGSFRSVRELTAAIGAFTGHWNEHPRPFAWTKDADEILTSINHAKTKAKGLTEH